MKRLTLPLLLVCFGATGRAQLLPDQKLQDFQQLAALYAKQYAPYVWKRDALNYDMEKVLDACAKHGVAMECNSYPDRLDLKDVYLRMCKDRGVKVVISTDSHTAANLSFIRYGVTTARRGWLTKKDVINTLRINEFLEALRPKPGAQRKKQAAKGR